MLVPPIPPDEAERLIALRRYEILDTLPEADFEAITRLAAAICDVPIVAISLVDAERQWFKSIVGLEATETSRDVSFCAHAMLHEEVMVVGDARLDPRFAQNPLVTGAPSIRFYAGAPLITSDHHALGALCVIDDQPRQLKPRQVEALQTLSRQVMALFELHRSHKELGKLNALLKTTAEENRRLSALIRQTSHAVILTDAQGCIEWVNAAFTQLTGYPAAAALGNKPGWLLQGPGSDPQTAQAIRAALYRRQPYRGEILNYRQDGAPYWVQLEIEPLLDADGTLKGYMSIQSDVTSRRLAEDATHASEVRFRTLAAFSPVGIFLTAADGSCIYTNARWQEIYGLDAQQSLGHGWSQTIHPEDQAGVFAQWQETARLGATFDYVFRIQPPSRPLRHVHSRARALLDEKGTCTGYVGSVEDITHIKETEAALRTARDQAQAASQAKGEFLATMSHELRTPLNGIIGFAELLADSPLTAEQREQASLIVRSGHDLLYLINDLLDFSKIEAGRMDLECVAYVPLQLCQDTLALLRPRATVQGIRLLFHAHPALPAQLLGDPHRVRQVLLNLLGNALKFTSVGSVQLDVRPATDAGDAPLRYTITDTGVGIPLERQGRLFQKFSQADSSTSRQFGGTGLGLAISQQLVQLMGGEIGFTSTPGQGSVFWFTLPARLPAPVAAAAPDVASASVASSAPVVIDTAPVARALGAADVADTSPPATVAAPATPALATIEPAAPAPDRPASTRSTPAIPMPLSPLGLPGHPLRVLLAEDNTTNQHLATLILHKLGCTVTLAVDGHQAVDLALQQPFDLILMDCQMPGLDGYDATMALRARAPAWPHLPIIALTANDQESERQHCLDVGMDDFISKPFSIKELHAMLMRWSPRPLSDAQTA